MAAAPLGQPPVRLSLERLGYYRDDNLRLWKVLSLRFTPDHPTHSNPGARVTVRLSQVDECCQEIRSPMFSCLACLPMSWMHLSLGLYSGSDVRLWKLVEHDWFGDIEQLELEMGNPIALGLDSVLWPMHPQ
ncbi:protein TCL1B1-like isoform X2 [Mesocricetus auratus]|uniref:Protein TCL1B1-like isoform X2 n=1 Tax=Mesocricetus auratus TaxID=10036 RepID=A0ABM2XC78_MESAU|nr:protein TCL1B1-like isoform X2 [Mesocricetus auratus]